MTRTMHITGIAALILTSNAALAIGTTGNILSLDASRTGNEGEAGDERFLTSSSMGNATSVLLDAGFNIGTTDSFVSANTAGWNTLYTGTVNVPFSAQELTDIQSFVSSGGGLVIQRDWGTFYPASDPLLAAFGVSVDTAGIGSPGTPEPVNKSAPHAIWDGPAGSATTFSQVFGSSIIGGADIIGNYVTGAAGLGVLDWGLGRVVILTDMDAWDDDGDTVSPIAGSNNAIVWENIFHHTVPAPSTGILLALGGLTAARRRR